LIWRVGGQKLSALNERIDHDGTVMGIGSRSQKTGVAFAIFPGALLEPVDDLGLGHLPGDGEIARQTVFRGDRRKEFVDGADADRLQHGGAIRGRLR
jgi:hypothetical protein